LSLQRSNSTVLFVIQSALNACVQTPCGKIRLDLDVDRLRAVLVDPGIQLGYFLLRERSDRPFDVPDRVPAHGLSI